MTLKHKNTGKWARQMLGRSDNAETQKALMEQLQKGDELMKKIRGNDDSDNESLDGDEDATEQGLQELEGLNNEDEQIPQTGIFAMKFMQRGFEQQKKNAQKDILKAQRELQGIDSDDEIDEKVVNGRQTFKHDPSIAEKLDLKVKQVTMPVEIRQPIFEVPSFEPSVDNKEKIDISGLEVKWMAEDSNSLVKRSVKPVHEQFARSNKTIKALSKLANAKKEILEETAFQESKIIVPEFEKVEQSEIKENLMNVESNVNDLQRSDIMQMAFANDNIEAVFIIN